MVIERLRGSNLKKVGKDRLATVQKLCNSIKETEVCLCVMPGHKDQGFEG